MKDVCVTYAAGDVKNRLEHFGRVYGWFGAKGLVDFEPVLGHHPPAPGQFQRAAAQR